MRLSPAPHLPPETSAAPEPLVPAMAMPVIAAHHLGKCYQIYENPNHRLKAALLPWKKGLHTEFWALRDVSFEIRRGEALGILGRNGSGKSTLLQLVAGILRPSEGAIVKQGRVSALLELGSGFNPEFTGRENVYLNGSVLGISAHQMAAIYDEIVNFADIGAFIDQPVKNYSSGMMVRLAFAVAVAVEPDILIVDEALAVGDIAFQRKCFRRIEEMRQNGLTLLWVTHDPGMIRQVCNRALVLDRGQVAGAGEAAEMADLYIQLMFGGLAPGAAPAAAPAVGMGEWTPAAGAAPAGEEGPYDFAAVPEALRYSAATHLAGVYNPADAGAYNEMPPFHLRRGRYRMEIRMAGQAAQAGAVEVMVADWGLGRVACGTNPAVAADALSTQTLEIDFDAPEDLPQAQVRVTNLGGATIHLSSIRLWTADPGDPALLHPVIGANATQMRYFNGREAVPFTTVPAAGGALAKIAAQDEALITRAALFSAAGQPRGFFHVDEEVLVVAEARILKPVEGLEFGILVRDKLGQDIFGQSCSNIQLQLPDALSPGTLLRFKARFRAALRQGTYFISLGLTDYSFTRSYFYGMDLLQLPLREVREPIFGIANLPHHFEGEVLALGDQETGGAA